MLSMLFYQSESDKILECSLYMYVNEKKCMGNSRLCEIVTVFFLGWNITYVTSLHFGFLISPSQSQIVTGNISHCIPEVE